MKCARCNADIARWRKYCSLQCYVEGRWGSAEDRFWSNVNISSGCWRWSGPTDKNGYGLFTNFWVEGKREQRAPRIAWILTIGAIPKGKWVLHHCDNSRCVNPSHLFIGDALANNRDMVSKGRQRYLCGEQSPGAVLTPVDVMEIRLLHAGGKSQRAIAKLFPVGLNAVNKVVRRKTWRNVP